MEKKRKKYSSQEVERKIGEIKSKYDHYIVQYLKPPSTKRAFEERYYYALKNRLDLTNFIDAEMSVLGELIAKEESLAASRAGKPQMPVRNSPRKPDFADRVIEENNRRIDKYPLAPVHEDAAVELARLYGALAVFEDEHWPIVEKVIRKAHPILYSSPYVNLGPKVFALCGRSPDGVPSRLGRYVAFLNGFPRNYNAIESEEKGCLLEAAFLLHEVSDALKEMSESDTLGAGDRSTVEQIGNFVHSVIEDFRLKDLKPKKR